MNNGTFEKITKEKKFIEKLVVLTRKCNKKKNTQVVNGESRSKKKHTNTHRWEHGTTLASKSHT